MYRKISASEFTTECYNEMSLLFKKCYFPLVSWSTKSISVNESIDFSLMCCNKKYLSMFSGIDSWDAVLDSVPAMMRDFCLFFMHEVVKSALFQNRISDLGSAGRQLSHLTVQNSSMDSLGQPRPWQCFKWEGVRL